MTTIHRAKYLGPYNFRALAPADLAKAGVDDMPAAVSFPRKQFVEVNQNVAEALVSNTSLFGRFEKDTIEREETPEPEATLFANTPAEPETSEPAPAARRASKSTS